MLLWTECAPHHSYIETLTPNVIVREYRAFGRQLGLDEVMRSGPWSMRLVSLSEGTLECSLSLYPAILTRQEHAGRSLPSASQEESPHEALIRPTPRTVRKSVPVISVM